MNSQFEVSIIIATYNPDFDKLMNSVRMASHQRNINYEIIITDDGSKQDFFYQVKRYFRKINFSNYRLIKNIKNVGTVKNLLGAVSVSRGEYVFLTSPGDYIFDSTTLSDFYSFSENNHVKVCFGDYIPYSFINGKLHIYDTMKPLKAEIYNGKPCDYQTYFFLGGSILGASYFRERDFLLNSLEYISSTSKYTEDSTTTAYAFMCDIPVRYYPRKIVWYEQGTGISTNGDNKWYQRIKKDLIHTYQALSVDYSKNKMINLGLYYLKNIDKKNGIVRIILRYPYYSIKRKRINRFQSRTLSISKDDINSFYDICCKEGSPDDEKDS